MAKREKRSKVQKRKLRRRNSAKRGKPRNVAKAAKPTVAGAKSKRASAKKAARKERMKQAAAPAAETVIVEIIEQPAPDAITVTEVEETPGSGLRRALKRMNPNR